LETAVVKKKDLQQYNGKGGKPAYIAYKGQIYDVSESEQWKNGVHMNNHKAGEDLTDSLSIAPHREEVIERFEKVGILEDEIEYSHANKRKEKLRDLYRKFHPHPMLIHFPIGSFFLGAVLQFFFLVTNDGSLENSAYYAYIFGTLLEFPAIASGVFSWWLNYESVLTPVFRKKFLFSIILILMSCFIVVTRLFIADISYQTKILSLAYNILIFFNVLIVAILGFYGGRITWH
jgi:predicted heme/steroid binding protein/uncharacterized membrane protein